MRSTAGSGERGFTLVEMLIATAIFGILATAAIQLFKVWAKGTVVAAHKARVDELKSDLRRLEALVRAARQLKGGYPSAGPWPVQVPGRRSVAWVRPAPGFEELRWAPSTSPVSLQYQVDGWATGFIVTAIGDLNKDGALELYRIWGDVSMFEGPLRYPPAP